ncbi:MAG: hypothetical protein ACI87A_002835, partial [Planctomycetota bacterium]
MRLRIPSQNSMMNFLTRAYPFLLLLIIGSCGDSADSKG